MERFRAMCEQAALALERSTAPGELDDPVRQLISSLEYDRGAVAGEPMHRAAMLRAAACFVRLFQLVAAEAPGLVCFGAEVETVFGGAGMESPPRRWSVSGTGLTLRAAFEGCIGEGVERLSLVGGAQHPISSATPADHLSNFAPATSAALSRLVGTDQAIDWVAATRLSDGTPAWLPADLCLLRDPARRGFALPYPIGIGCAAGPSFEAAALHALLEVIERDAACLWWQGGARGRSVRLEGDVNTEAASLLTALRKGRQQRRSWLLDITTTDLGVPCIASISSTADGFGFACGMAARLTAAQAARAAIFEMCQMELAHQIVELKRQERGEAGFNDLDRAHIRRRREIDTQSCALVHPLPPAPAPFDFAAADPAQSLRALIERLARHGIDVFGLDLTRPSLGIPVARIVCPALEKESSGPGGPRLQAMVEQAGGGESYTRGVPLL
jgi:ribosomal protein S12 methylthiotransferase accessory factor